MRLSRTRPARPPTAQHAYGKLVDERTPSGRLDYLYDGIGWVVGLTDSAGNVANAYKYDPYGNRTQSSGSAPNVWGFASGYLATAGLYQQADRYAYAGNDPVNLDDPSGLHSPGTNGCTGVPDAPGGYNFHSACDGHDLCYGARRGRAYCDGGFYRTLRTPAKVCYAASSDRQKFAFDYYVGVRLIGWGPYYFG